MGIKDMVGTYEQRVVANYQDKEIGLVVDTALVTDSTKPYETAIQHPSYHGGAWIAVELYDSKKEAQAGHDKWVDVMTREKLPDFLRDASSSFVSELGDMVLGDDKWRIRRKNE